MVKSPRHIRPKKVMVNVVNKDVTTANIPNASLGFFRSVPVNGRSFTAGRGFKKAKMEDDGISPGTYLEL